MARERDFEVGAAVKQLNKIVAMELATIVYYTHYAFMIYGQGVPESLLFRTHDQ